MEKQVNLFGNKASLLMRTLLAYPEDKRTVPSFKEEGVSLGMASMTANQAEAAGYIEHVRRVEGESYCRLIRRDALLRDWTSRYDYRRNRQATYISQDPRFEDALASYMERKGVRFAFTLFSASRLISPYVKDGRHFAYLDVAPQKAAPLLKDMRAALGLAPAKTGWNVSLASPYYKSAVFRDVQRISGKPVVSNLQLYLDLMGFPPLGRQELEENLIPLWKEKGVSFV